MAWIGFEAEAEVIVWLIAVSPFFFFFNLNSVIKIEPITA